MNKSNLLSLLILVLVLLSSCRKKDLATITTDFVVNITTTSATVGAKIQLEGRSNIYQSGICWATESNPTTNNDKTEDGGPIGSFNSHLAGLAPNTTYYVRAFAINDYGTAYGNELVFTTAKIMAQPGAGVAFNGRNYTSTLLGNGQEWMAENLRSTAYANGDPIPNVETGWDTLTSGVWTHYLDNNQYENPHGKLYNWYTVEDPRNVCPTGWHVPSMAEWEKLINYVGGADVAGGKLKSTDFWLSPNVGATNESGFSGVPGGSRVPNGFFSNFNYDACYWTSTESTTPGIAKRFILQQNSDNIIGGGIEKTYGYSIRCIKD